MDHESVNIRSTTMSCGVMELSRISDDVEKVLYQIASHLYHPSRGAPCAFFVWSDVVLDESTDCDTNADMLRHVVLKKEFGDISLSHPAENPRTGNYIVVFMWKIHHNMFKAWYREERVRRMRKVGR